MNINHLVVSQRESVWQFSFRGDVTGPFTSKDAAIKAALAAARAVRSDTVEVVVRDAEMRNQTIWRSGQADQTRHETGQLAADAERDGDA